MRSRWISSTTIDEVRLQRQATEDNMPMKNPPHPGGLIRREVIDPLGLTVSDAAATLGVTRQALSLLLNERTGLSSEMALRIEKALGTKMDNLMRMYLSFDLASQSVRE